MASILDRLKSLGRGLLSQIGEGAARAVASFAERYERNASLVYQQRTHLPRAQVQQLARQHRTGERMMASTMRGAGGLAWPASWTARRDVQVTQFHRWVHIACDRICSTIASLPPKLAYVRPRRSRRKKPRGEGGTGTVEKGHAQKPRNRRHGRTKRRKLQAYYEARFRKSLHAIHPHEEVEEVGDDHPCMRLLKKPNAWDHSPGQLWYELVLFLLLTGNAYLWVVPDAAFSRPLELWVIPSHWVWGPQLNAGGKTEYKIMPFTGGFGSFTIPNEEIIHFAFKNPLNKIDGFSPTQAGAQWVDVSTSVDDSRYWTFKQGTQSNFALELGPRYDPDDIDIDGIGAKFLSRYQGERNAGVPIIPPPDVKVVPLSIAPKEMAFEGGFEQMRDAIMALFAVPKGIAGITDPGSDRALWGERAVFMDQAIKPRLQYIAETFTATVCKRWDDELRFFWEDPTPTDPQQVNSDINLDAQHGAITPNQIATLRGREPFDDPLLDEPWFMPNMVPFSVLKRQFEQQEQQAAQQQAMPQPSAPGGVAGGAGGAPDLAALASGQQPQSDQPQSDQQAQAGKFDLFGEQDNQADAQDAALDANDQAWTDRGKAVQKAHEYNVKAKARGSPWRLEPDATGQRWRAVRQKKNAEPRLIAAGLAVVADDTGRALMLQRSLDENGTNGGKWEFPGGHIEDSEPARQAAVREWQEETGLKLPDGGAFSGVWNARNGIYRGYVYRVPSEETLDLFGRDREANPDGDDFEAVAWIDPADFENHNLRSELLADIPSVRTALRAVSVSGQRGGMIEKHRPTSKSDNLDAQGGELPAIDPAMLRKADFITYPNRIKQGSNCSSCEHNQSIRGRHECTFHDAEKGIDLRGQPVNDRNCCGEWSAPGTLRAWKAGGAVEKSWEASKHPRGGNPKNPGWFSSGAGGAHDQPTRYPSLPGAPGAKEQEREQPQGERPGEKTRPYPGPEQQPEVKADQTRETGGVVRPTPVDYLQVRSTSPSSWADHSPLHKILEQKRKMLTTDLSSGVNRALLLRLADGTKGVFKPQNGESKKSIPSIPPQTGFRREVVASRVADLLGMSDLVPTTTFRTEQGEGIGSMQVYVAGAKNATEVDPKDIYDGQEDASRAAVLDYLFCQLDRHQNNWMLKDGKLALIDNGRAFPTHYEKREFELSAMWHMEFLRHAVVAGLDVPDLTEWRGKWDQLEKELSDCGLEEGAMALARERFDALANGTARKFADLPGFLPDHTLGSLFAAYGKRPVAKKV